MDDENTVKIEVETPAAENAGGVSGAVADAAAILAVAEGIAEGKDNSGEYRALHARIDELFGRIDGLYAHVDSHFTRLHDAVMGLTITEEVTQAIVEEVADTVIPTGDNSDAETVTEKVTVEEIPPANSDAPEVRIEEVKTRKARWV